MTTTKKPAFGETMMMEEPRLLTAIDIGTTKVCTIVARQTGPTDFEILGYSVVPHEGLRKGSLADVTLTEQSVRASLKKVETKTGLSIQSAYVGVSGTHVSYENRWDTIDWAGEHGVITHEDLMRVPNAVSSASRKVGRQVIHAIPMVFSLDGKRGIRNPMGMHTSNLKVKSHVVTGTPSAISSLVESVTAAGVAVTDMILVPLASSEAVLTPEEKHRGAAVADIGGGSTDIVVFKGGSVCHTSVVPVGGFQFTNDICHTYNTPYEAAEAAKLQYAHTEPHAAPIREEVSLPVIGRTLQLKVARRDICQITRERAQEIVRLIKLKLVEAQVEDIGMSKLVLTGGSANLRGLEELVRRTLTSRVRLGIPIAKSSIPNELRDARFSTAVGMILWAVRQPRYEQSPLVNGAAPRTDQNGTPLFSRLLSRVRSLA